MNLWLVSVTAVCACCSAHAADRVWQAAGDGEWSDPANWAGGTLPGASDTAVFDNALSADATVEMDSDTPLIGKIRVDNPDNAHTRIFTGTQTVRSNEFVKGRTELRGAWLSDYKGITGVGQAAGQRAWLTLSGDAVFMATNQHALYLGNANNALGRVTVKDNARLTLSTEDTDFGISLGRNTGSVGSFVQEGGVVESVGRFLPGYNGYGAYELLGGALNLPYGADNTRYRLAVQANSTGLFYQRGGALRVPTNALSAVVNFFEVCSANNNAHAVYYADGGTATFEVSVRMLAGAGANSSPSYAEFTLEDDAVAESGQTFYLRSPSATYSAAVSALNLNRGGTLRIPNLLRGNSGRSALNADGGTLELVRASELTTLFQNIPVVIYEGGLTLRFPAGSGATLSSAYPFRNPGGWGVVSVAVTDGGSGYLAPPRVTLSGGGGSNATAVAFIDHASGAVTGVVVTCRGEGYAGDDVLTAGFSGGGGSGGGATVTLAENRSGAFVKSGTPRLVTYAQPDFDGEYVVREGLFLQSSRDAGAPNIRAVRVSGLNAVFQNGSGSVGDNTPAKWDLINPAAALYLGGDRGSGELLLPCGVADTVFQQHYASLELGFGRNRLTTTSQNATNGAALTFETVRRAPGSALWITTTTNLAVHVDGDASAIAFGDNRPVLPAVFIGDVTDFTTLDEDGRLVKLDENDAGFGAGSNYWVQASAAAGGLTVNSLKLDDAVTLTLEAEGTTVVDSGMVAARAGSAGNTRVMGGTLTSGNGVDLILFDFHNTIERRNVANGKSGLIVDSLIADNSSESVALFALGRTWNAAQMSIATGPAVELTRADNTYSGGTYILDTALAVAGDGSLGPVPAQPTNNIFTSGVALLRAPADSTTVSLHANRHIRVCDGGLTFFGDTGSQAGRVLFDMQGDISGEGVLVMNHWAGGGVRSVVALGGDNRAFKGTVAVHGMLRPSGEHSLPPNAGLLLCDVSSVNAAGGVLQTSGAFARAPGTGAGQVWWGRVTEVAPGYVSSLATPAGGGGFSAYGGPLTVNLGGDRRVLTWGVDGFLPERLRLQDDEATDELTWENPVDVTNQTLTVQVAHTATDKRAVWRGAVTSSAAAGGGGFTKIGNGRLVLADGADFGPVAFTANNTLELLVTNRQTLACDMSGNAVFVEKYGAGCTVMSGSNTYGQATRVYEGALLVNGTNTDGGTFTVWPGAALGGTGTAAPKQNATVIVNGALAPGAEEGACGTLTLGSAEQATVLTLNGTLAVEIGTDACDHVAVFGNVAFEEDASVSVTALDETVWRTRRGERIPLLTWTGGASGISVLPLVEALPTGWKVTTDAASKTVWLAYAPLGTVIGVR
jgi:autotransporter-associated beta strand protein